MTAQAIALYCPSCKSAAGLRQRLEPEFRIHVLSGSLSQLPREVGKLRPNILIADVTQAAAGGHAESGILEAIQE